MAKSHLQKLKEKDMTRKEFLTFGLVIFASLFGIVGVIKQLLSHAATATATGEAEGGNVASPATVVSDAGASGGAAIKFQPVPTPTPSPTKGYKPFIGAFVNPVTVAAWQADEARVGQMTALKTYNPSWPTGGLTWANIPLNSLASRCQVNLTIKPNLTNVLSNAVTGGITMDNQFRNFINSIPVVKLTDQYGNQRPSKLIQFWGEAMHENLNIPNWQAGAVRWGKILKSMHRPDLFFGVCLQDINWGIKGNFNGKNNIGSYYTSNFIGVLDYIGVDVYSEFPGAPGNFGFIQQGTNFISNTQLYIDYFKKNWPGIKICTPEIGFGENPKTGGQTKASQMRDFYNTMVASGISESIMYFDSGADPLNTSAAATAEWKAIIADSKAV